MRILKTDLQDFMDMTGVSKLQISKVAGIDKERLYNAGRSGQTHYTEDLSIAICAALQLLSVASEDFSTKHFTKTQLLSNKVQR